jgi:thioredoxin-related protein
MFGGLLLGLGSDTSKGSERFKLVMVEEAGCVYCARWHAEVGQAYANSPEGKFAPLERVAIGDASLGYLSGLRYTPTFVLVEGQREIGRITGYPGADFFWSLLAPLLAKTPFAAPPGDEIKT